MKQTLATMRGILMEYVPGFTPNAVDAAIQRAYDGLCSMYPWHALDTEFKIVTVAYIDDGGVKFNNGTTSVTAATTVSANWSSTADAYKGYFLKKNTNDEAAYYTICASTSVLLTLSEAYLGKTTTASASSGDSYFIFKHIYPVPSAIETVTHIMGGAGYLEQVDRYMLEQRNPDLDWEGEPSKWCTAGINSANQALIQFYPPKVDDIYELRGWGRLRVEALTSTTTPLIDSNLIIAFAEVELMKRKRMLAPSSVSDDMLKNAVEQAQLRLQAAMELDGRAQSKASYVADNFFMSHHPGQKWLVSHDSWDY